MLLHRPTHAHTPHFCQRSAPPFTSPIPCAFERNDHSRFSLTLAVIASFSFGHTLDALAKLRLRIAASRTPCLAPGVSGAWRGSPPPTPARLAGMAATRGEWRDARRAQLRALARPVPANLGGCFT